TATAPRRLHTPASDSLGTARGRAIAGGRGPPCASARPGVDDIADLGYTAFTSLPPHPGRRHERSDAHPVRHRAGRAARRRPALAAGLRRIAPTGSPEARPGKAGPHAAGDGGGP